jgi:lipoic acid synthetase
MHKKLRFLCSSRAPELAGMTATGGRSHSLMKVKHAVITSVDRDELKDGGSTVWHNTIKAVKALNADTTLETLIPDFKGNKEDIQRIMDAAPEVISHNIETVERLTKQVRIQAKYWRSMEVIRILKQGGMRTKSGIMLGLGEQKGK